MDAQSKKPRLQAARALEGSRPGPRLSREPRHPRSVRSAPVALPEELSALVSQGTVRTFRRDATIISEGDELAGLHIVVSGRVKLFVTDGHGREIVLATLGPAEYYGATILAEERACAALTALETSSVAIVPRERLTAFLLAHPSLGLELARELARRVQFLTESVKTFAFLDVHARVLRLLRKHSKLEGARLALRMPHQEIAGRVGASPEMVSRVLRELAAIGHISLEKRRITLREPPTPSRKAKE